MISSLIASSSPRTRSFCGRTLLQWIPNRHLSSLRGLNKASLVRSVVELRRSGTFSTVSLTPAEGESQIYGTAVMPYVLLDSKVGVPIIALRQQGVHVKHLKDYANASLVVFPLTPKSIPPTKVDLFRANLTGEVLKLEGADHMEAKKKFISVHPALLEFPDLDLYALQPNNVCLYERGKTTQITVQEYENAQTDVVSKDSAEIIELMNTKHPRGIVHFCKEYGDVQAEEAFVYWVDGNGLNIMARKKEKDAEEWIDLRVPFPFEMNSAMTCRDSLMDTARSLELKYGQ